MTSGANKEKLIRKFDKQARIYEKRRINQSEKEWRKKLIQCARGNILEVGVGAGANFNFYSKDVHVTAVDFSKEMLSKARQSAAENRIETDFIRSDIETLSFPDQSFETIVSTLTLCGYDDPALVLKKFSSWCKRDGQILLMEHGVSSNPLIRPLQAAVNPLFKKVVGCHLNRDMMKLIHESIHIERAQHYMFGSIHLIWARPERVLIGN